MEIQRQWCDQESCPDFGKIGINNIRIYSHAERRFYCTTCNHTFCADKGTFFETLRTEKNILLDAVAMLVERNSLRAISRIKQSNPTFATRAKKIGKLLILRSRIFKGRHYKLDFLVRR